MKRKNEPVAVSEARPPARSESVIVAPEENPEESKATAEESSGIHQATPKGRDSSGGNESTARVDPEFQIPAPQVENPPDDVPIAPRKKMGRPKKVPVAPVVVAPFSISKSRYKSGRGR
jgi:hypothetical protein